MSRGRYQYTPTECGWIAVDDLNGNELERIDCRNGGAQEVYERRCKELQAEGWTLEKRFADHRFLNRNGERRTIGIVRDANFAGSSLGMWGGTDWIKKRDIE